MLLFWTPPPPPWFQSICTSSTETPMQISGRGKEAGGENGTVELALLAVYRDAAGALERKAHRSDCATGA